jgi:hypothetical protein
MMGISKMYGTNKVAEQKGVVFSYGDDRLTLARAGGANDKFKRVMEDKLRPHKRAFEQGRLREDISNQIMTEAYAETIILNWETQVDGEWVQGIGGTDGSVIEFNVANVVRMLNEYPDFFRQVRADSSDLANYLAESTENDLKN